MARRRRSSLWRRKHNHTHPSLIAKNETPNTLTSDCSVVNFRCLAHRLALLPRGATVPWVAVPFRTFFFRASLLFSSHLFTTFLFTRNHIVLTPSRHQQPGRPRIPRGGEIRSPLCPTLRPRAACLVLGVPSGFRGRPDPRVYGQSPSAAGCRLTTDTHVPGSADVDETRLLTAKTDQAPLHLSPKNQRNFFL